MVFCRDCMHKYVLYCDEGSPFLCGASGLVFYKEANDEDVECQDYEKATFECGCGGSKLFRAA